MQFHYAVQKKINVRIIIVNKNKFQLNILVVLFHTLNLKLNVQILIKFSFIFFDLLLIMCRTVGLKCMVFSVLNGVFTNLQINL